ncbi:hypothetical protein TRIUR3_02944 [Triticum urartu]|uniref:Uncharacterized protein n=1 Tax=Triticum urartu TaxID=4572 RepID=M7ZHL1_TRIUA|nr:hypothetical protein TRIUR3_02944 [Triticum urartu]
MEVCRWTTEASPWTPVSLTLWSMASTRYESLLHFFWFVCYDLATGMQGEAAAVSRGREDAHHEGVSGMMEVISARSPSPSTGGGHRLLFHGVVGAFPCQAQRLLGWITVAHLTGVVGKICISILATLHPLAVIFLSHNPYADDKVCCTSLWHTDPTGGRKPLGITRASFTRCLQFVEKRMVEDCKGLWSTLLGVGPDISINVYVYESLRSHWKNGKLNVKLCDQ